MSPQATIGAVAPPPLVFFSACFAQDFRKHLPIHHFVRTFEWIF